MLPQKVFGSKENLFLAVSPLFPWFFVVSTILWCIIYLSLSIYIYAYNYMILHVCSVFKKYNIYYIYIFMYVYPSWLVEYATNVMPTPSAGWATCCRSTWTVAWRGPGPYIGRPASRAEAAQRTPPGPRDPPKHQRRCVKPGLRWEKWG